MITDKEKFAALIYYYIKDSKESDPKFKYANVIGESGCRILKGSLYPTRGMYAKIVKKYPALYGTLEHKSMRGAKLTDEGERAFAALLATGNAKLRRNHRGRVGAEATEISLSDRAKVAAVRPAVIGRGSSGPMMWARLGKLAMKSPDTAGWIQLLEDALKNHIPLNDLVVTLRDVTKEN